MNKLFLSLMACFMLLSACGPSRQVVVPTATAQPTETRTPVPPTATVTVTPTVTATFTPSPSPTPNYPPEGRGPAGFPVGINPLTGLEVDNATTLERRPIVIKVENLPREHRPQWGLSMADLVYEYYTEQGTTRFAAVFYGDDAQQVGPIRSGRFFDANVVQMYKGVFVYGSAYPPVQSRFFNSDFYNRLILENSNSCPALCRFDPGNQNLLVANTEAMADYLKLRNVDNSVQNLDGMFFQMVPPAGGDEAEHIYVRYSAAIYNRWDYDPATGTYLRFSDAQNAFSDQPEVYAQLTDRLNDEAIAAENVVQLCVPHQYFVKREDIEVMDIIMDTNRMPSYVSACDGQTYPGNTGPAFIARDGKLYKVTWKRERADSVLTLFNADGSLFPFKPGQTWFEVLGASSEVLTVDDGFRFVHHMAP